MSLLEVLARFVERLVQSEIGLTEKGGEFRVGRFVQSGSGTILHQSLLPQPLSQGDPLFGLRRSG